VLIADDDAVSLATLSRCLRAAGFATIEASNTSMALQLCQQAPPSLAILDYDMPCASGIEFPAALHSSGHFPMIFLSTRTDDATVRGAVDAGATAYFFKPIDPIKLIPTIRTALQRFSELQTLRGETEQLASALKASRHTSVVVGLLMERLQLPETEAYNQLRHYARSHGRKVADVASEILSAAGLLNEAIMQIGAAPTKRGRALDSGLQKS
jgi:response regulator NasT